MKKRVEKVVFSTTSNRPILWKEIKHVDLQDNDLIQAGFDPGFYEESNASPPGYFVTVTRMVEETDGEHQARLQKEEAEKLRQRETRHKHYLILKQEFENE